MQDDPKQKQDADLAQQNTHLNLSHLIHHQPLQVNLFLPLTDIQLQKLQSPLDQPKIPNIQEQQAKSSRLNYNSQQQNLLKNDEKKRKYSQKSDNYHRVRNSRKIRTKKVTKDYLQRSQYFYVDDITEKGADGPIMSLLNEYEAFQQAIFNACFEKRIIKLSHYGNKNKIKKSSIQQASHMNSISNNNNHLQQRSRSFKESPSGVNNHLSKSVVQNHTTKLFVCPGVVSYQNKLPYPELYFRDSPIHSVELHNNVDQKMSKKLTHENNVSKHTTPVRTIFLNQAQKKSNLYSNQTNQSSPIQKVSYFTPLVSERMHKKNSLKPFKSILQHPAFNESHQQYRMKNRNGNSIQTNSAQTPSNSNKPCGISVVSAKKDNDTNSQQRNIKVADILKHGFNQNSRAVDEMILAQQIALPHNPYKHKSNHNFSDLQKFSFTLTSQQSQSRSRSKRGLSLTQSMGKFKAKKELIKTFSKSIESTIQKKEDHKGDILEKKLNLPSSIPPKRVEIRIY